LGFLEGVQEEDGDPEAVVMLEAALAEIGGGEYSPLETDQLETEVFDIDVRVLSGSGDMELRGADVGTVIFLFDPIESDLAVDVLESALSSDVFCGARAERIRAFIESIKGNHPMSIN
jgi:FixJ family two-component response regulator